MNLNLIKRWFRMLKGKSSFHVEQGEGKFYSKTQLKGYYNDLTNKVKTNSTLLDEYDIPYNITIHNKKIYFPGTIFQYGLGLYDLYLETNKKEYLDKFLKIAEWTFTNQLNDGIWECMSILCNTLHETRSSMCQSQGISVLVRAYHETNLNKYLKAADKAITIMIKKIEDGGTCYINDHDCIFQEYVSKDNQSVLNGWIFSIFGLYDYYLITKDKKIKAIINNTVDTLAKYISKYDRKYWSSYDLVGTIASPSYHELHIKQLNVLYDMFGKDEFRTYAKKWEKYSHNKIYKILAILKKGKQKICKNKYYDINTSLVR